MVLTNIYIYALGIIMSFLIAFQAQAIDVNLGAKITGGSTTERSGNADYNSNEKDPTERSVRENTEKSAYYENSVDTSVRKKDTELKNKTRAGVNSNTGIGINTNNGVNANVNTNNNVGINSGTSGNVKRTLH